jgi:hypothetical protein
MAYTRAGDGSYGDFRNPEFVQPWSQFIYSVLEVLNMDLQLVYNEISKKGFQTLIYDYKRVKDGEVGIIYWKATGAKTRAQVEVDIRQAICILALPC